jgi:hypothetical protein
MKCPNCAADMKVMRLDSRMGTPVKIDLCAACQAFWFDKYESLALSYLSALKLVTLINEAPSGKVTLSPELRCPRCATSLLFTHDLQGNTRFSYWRCSMEHGRFIGFVDFLREKSFIHALTPEEKAELRRKIRFVNCRNCGAAIDLTTASVCPHCGSPVTMVDMKLPS